MSLEVIFKHPAHPAKCTIPPLAEMMAELGLRAFSMSLVLATLTGQFAYAQSVSAPDQSTMRRPISSESSGAATAVAYCPDLKGVVTLALTKERFRTIVGNPRNGDFLDTTLPLTGWKDCSLYGSRTYTCDSRDLASAGEAARLQAVIMGEIKSCLGENWAEDPDRSSSTYVVLRSSPAPVSMTISTNPNETNGYVVRLTLFLRTGG